MTLRQLFRFSMEILDSNPDWVARNIEALQYDALVEKSFRVLHVDIRFGHNGDDFIRNMRSAIVYLNGCYIPRFLKVKTIRYGLGMRIFPGGVIRPSRGLRYLRLYKLFTPQKQQQNVRSIFRGLQQPRGFRRIRRTSRIKHNRPQQWSYAFPCTTATRRKLKPRTPRKLKRRGTR